MNIEPKDPWVAKVHKYMRESKTCATAKQIQDLFGRPGPTKSAGIMLYAAMEGGWFRIVAQRATGRGQNSYEAVEKTGLRRSSAEVQGVAAKQPARASPASIPTPTPPRYASVWDYGQGKSIGGGLSVGVAHQHIMSDQEPRRDA